jgi:DNA-binding NtrC family response regulator
VPLPLGEVSFAALADYAVRAGVDYRWARREFDRAFLTAILENCDWNVCRVARNLGMHRNTLGRKLEELQIARPHWHLRKRISRKPLASCSALARREQAS